MMERGEEKESGRYGKGIGKGKGNGMQEQRSGK